MEMMDGLAGIRSVVREHPVPAANDTFLLRHHPSKNQEIGRQLGVIGPEVAEGHDMSPGDDQDVRRGLRRKIANRD